jgi:TatD DNase family protein
MLGQPVGEVLAAARAARITRVVTVGVDLPTSQWSARCAAEGEGVYAAVAVHPNETAKVASTPAQRDAVLAEIAALAALPQVRAVGETGLDYYWDDAPPPLQREWFRAHIEIAKQAGKPLMIHDRDAHDDILRILDDDGPPERVVFHCFSGDAAMAKRCADAGYVMSFAGTVTFRNAPGLREAAAAAPASLILAETDSPYLTPMPYRGRPNTPAMVAHTVRCLAEVRQISVADMCALITATGERMFGPW